VPTFEVFTSLLTGSLGALVFMAMAVYALVTGIVHPNKAYQAQVERVKLLEEENTRLNGSIVSLTDMNTTLQIDLATLKSEVEHLRERLDRLLEERSRV
jgi:TolA-binding protein